MSFNFAPLDVLNRTTSWLRIKEETQSAYGDMSQVFSRPFITLAREPGSGGEPIAKALAEKLGYEFVDEQLVEAIARSTKRRKETISTLDEKTRSVVEDLVHSLLNPEYVEETRFIKELFRTILAYAYKGRVVILGRGANFITPFARGLHVMVTAPYAVRVQRAIDYEGHTREKAKQVIAEVEAQRRDFINKYISKDARKPYAYDLTLNTQYYQIHQSCQIIIEALKQKFPRKFGRR